MILWSSDGDQLRIAQEHSQVLTARERGQSSRPGHLCQSNLKEAIARGDFTAQEKGTLGPQYDPIFTELAVVEELIVRGARIAVPKSLRDKVVKLAHEVHQGVIKTKEYLRTRVWFPGLDKMVEAHIHHPCQAVNVSQEREPLRMRPMPREPWKEVAMDSLGPNSYRRVPAGHRLQAVQMGRGRVRHLNQCLSGDTQAGQNLRLAWLTRLVSSDNGPPFNGKAFSDFGKYLGLRYERKTPLNPQTNAEAEQFMRILKKIYQISLLMRSNFKHEVYRFLGAYGATPHCTTKIAPVEVT